jgi:G patch domain-containing protein 1
MSGKGIRYVPRHKRKPERLHGAFAGGFSAGYFNTVGSAEGWQPRNEPPAEESQQASQQQSVGDFMDEQDHNEWGGPQAVRSDMAGRPQAAEEGLVTSARSLNETLFRKDSVAPVKHVGSKLLQRLGWREGSATAFVPQQQQQQPSSTTGAFQEKGDTPTDEATSQFLSARRLRKIRVQQNTIRIPPPKLDQVGLGFEAYANAPEFQAFNAKRKRLAQDRATGKHRSVYRLSNVLATEDAMDEFESGGGDEKRLVVAQNDSNENYESYEVTQDFVGSRSVGGFALRDDEDDAFDDNDRALTKVSNKVHIDKDEYNTVIDDPHSDDDDVDPANQAGQAAEALASGLLSWTDTSGTQSTKEGTKITLLTSDGRPPLPGFGLGGSGGTTKMQRYRGPDLPDGYRVEPHVFTEEEHPLVWKTLARAVQLEANEVSKAAAVQEALASNRIQQKKVAPPKPRAVAAPMMNPAFASMADAMKNRFTAGKNELAADAKSALPSGLVQASALPRKDNATQPSLNASAIRRDLSVKRTAQSFAPAPLVCKRFSVRPPTLHSAALVPAESSPREESFFSKEILTAVAQARSSGAAKDAAALEQQEATTPVSKILDERPSMQVYQSIFGTRDSESEPDSEDDQGDGTETSPGRKEDTETPGSKVVANQPNRQTQENPSDKKASADVAVLSGSNGSDKNAPTWSSDSSRNASDDEARPSLEKKRKKGSKRSRDKSNSETLDGEEDSSIHDRKQKKKKKKKSRRKSHKREREEEGDDSEEAKRRRKYRKDKHKRDESRPPKGERKHRDRKDEAV